MKLRNKKTGEIIEFEYLSARTDDHDNGECIKTTKIYDSLAELNKEWEDYEEDKYYYAITSIKADGGITKMKNIHNDMTAFDKSIGNYFETKEEAEKAVEKLKAWKRLKDKGFRFTGWQDLEACDETEKLVANRIVDGENIVGFKMDDYHDCFKDLNICFGGEE